MKISTTRIPRFSAFKTFLLAAFLLTASISVLATASIDTTFGTSGRAALPLGSSQRIVALALQNNGKIIVAGDVYNSNTQQQDGAVVRYNSNGTLDTSFGDGGKVVLQLMPRFVYFQGVAVQADGKIVAVGSIPPTEGSPNTDFLIVRFRENGSLDSGFGNNGIIIANQGSQDAFRAVKLQSDGKIVAAGGTSDSGGRGAVFRFNQDGSYDTSFGGGFVLIDFPNGASEIFTSLDFYADSRILLGGERVSGTGPGSRNGFLTLLEPNGSVAQSFGSNGFREGISLENGSVKTKVKVLPSGKFIVAEDLLRIYSGNGDVERNLYMRNPTGLAFLSNGNSVIVSRSNFSAELRGIRIYNTNFRLVGSDEADFSTGNLLFGTDVVVQPNDKIVILRDNEVVRLNAVTSDATRVIHFDDDRKTDIAGYRPSNYTFYGLRSSNYYSFNPVITITAPPAQQRQIIAERYSPGGDTNNVLRSDFAWFNYATNNSPAVFGINNQATFQFGAFGDVPVGGDYDGDRLTDYTVFRPSNGTWYISPSSNNQFRAFAFGQAGDKLVPADYDYDGITDFAVFRPSNGTWYISRSSDGGFRAAQFGANGDVPLTGDFDGDGRADFTVFRPSNGVWYSLKTSEGFSAEAFGISSDQPVPGDYDGDGRHDIAVFRAGVWYINQTRDGFKAIQWGLPSDVPVTVRY